MTTKEEIMKLAVECGIKFKPLPRDLYCEIWLEQLEAFYHAARKPLEAVCLDYDRKLHESQREVDELSRQLADMSAHYQAALEAEQVRYRQLAAAQAQIVQYREALSEVAGCPRAVRLLIEVARCADRVFDGNEEGTYINCSEEDACALSNALCELETLPDNKPGYTLSGPARAEWLLASYVSNIEALAQPTDTSALEAYIAEAGEVMRERCLYEADIAYHNKHCCDEIRALPGVTLADLK